MCPIAFVVFTVIPISVSLIKCEDLFQAWPLWIKIASMRLEAKQKKTLKFRSNHKYFYETFVSGINEKKVEIKLHISICVEKLLNEAPGCLELYFYFLVFFPKRLWNLPLANWVFSFQISPSQYFSRHLKSPTKTRNFHLLKISTAMEPNKKKTQIFHLKINFQRDSRQPFFVLFSSCVQSICEPPLGRQTKWNLMI